MEVKFVASWNPDVEKIYNADAQKVAEEIFALGEKIETKDILEMARDEKKEIHKLIEWDDTVAADRYRLHQCRLITKNLRIVKIGIKESGKMDKILQPTRMFYSMVGETGYRPTPCIIQDEDLTNKLLMTAKSELNAFMIKYATLTDLEPVFKAIRELDNPSNDPAA